VNEFNITNNFIVCTFFRCLGRRPLVNKLHCSETYGFQNLLCITLKLFMKIFST